MGAWGTAIFSDDLASDVRGDWRDLLLDGVEAEKAAARIVDEYAEARRDPDDSIVFWLALAAAQTETGRLQDDVRDRALSLIRQGGDMARWEAEEPGQARSRKQVLNRLAEKLEGPQPAPKRLRRRRPLGVEFELGDAIRLSALESDRQALAVVVDEAETYPKGGRNPVIEFLAWDSDTPIPSPTEMVRMPGLLSIDDLNPRPLPHLWVIGTHRKDQAFNAAVGEVVASNVERTAPGDYRVGSVFGPVRVSYATWRAAQLYAGGQAFVRDLELASKRKRPRRFLRRR